MSGDSSEQYACKCLNVRIISSPAPSAPPQYPRDPNYTPVFVKDDGISVAHPQVTVRVPLQSEPIPGTSKSSRFIVLTCLFCSLPIYRVHNTISQGVDGAQSTLLPSEDWVEREILKTSTGWIDVHKDSIAGSKIPEALKSASYVPIFSLALPPTSPTPQSPSSSETASSELETELLAPPKSPEPEEPETEYLSDLKPLFLPPPFTSSHPIFVHLAGLATNESHELRAAAQRRIADFVTAEKTGLEAKETELKQQVEVLWKSFRRNLDAVQHERPTVLSNLGRSLPRSTPSVASPAPSSSVTIREFIPQRIASPQRHTSSSSAPRVSALSASLKTSQFHHPREQAQSPSRSVSSNGTVSSPRSISSTIVSGNTRPDVVSILQYGPKNNDTMNTEASYRYFVNLEEDMARYKEAQAQSSKKLQEAEAAKRPQEAGPSGTQTKAKANGIKDAAPPSEDPKPEPSSSRSREKAKKVVKFVEPVSAPTEEKAVDATEESMMFPYEPDDVDGAAQTSTSPQNTLPLLEQPVPRSRPRNPRAHVNPAHEAFPTLRPSSLPAPSHIRPMRSGPGVDSFSRGMILNLPRIASGNRSDTQPVASSSLSSRPMTENEAAILKLVAADTPSHRGLWTPESKAWREFTRRQNSKDETEHSNIPEEYESETSSTAPKTISMNPRTTESQQDDDVKSRGIPGSIPINIINRIKPKEVLSLASYRPPNAIPEEAAAPAANVIGNKPLSSTAIRKALYTQRDRTRSMDPGALDFAVEQDDEEDASEASDHEQATLDAGEEGRRKALKIIQARDEVPAEGMWRSLA